MEVTTYLQRSLLFLDLLCLVRLICESGGTSHLPVISFRLLALISISAVAKDFLKHDFEYLWEKGFLCYRKGKYVHGFYFLLKFLCFFLNPQICKVDCLLVSKNLGYIYITVKRLVVFSCLFSLLQDYKLNEKGALLI